MSGWGDIAHATIQRVHETLPADLPLKDRKKAIDAAYPFGARKYWPYKAWCKARRKYLERYGLKPLRPPQPSLFETWARDPETGRPIIPDGPVSQ